MECRLVPGEVSVYHVCNENNNTVKKRIRKNNLSLTECHLYLGCLLLTISGLIRLLQVTKTDSGPLFGGPVANDSSSKDAVHFIASQMILPKAAGLEGCTVVSYYRILLQKAADFELGSTDPSKASRPPATDLLLIPCNSPGRSFNNISLCADGFLSRSLQR